jgi:serine phosphatase RsbU (regulator of sigma subunit)
MTEDLAWLVQSHGWTSLDACGVQVTVGYRCADPGQRAGGDWYLSMPLAHGDLLLAVGDVAGHGLEAAAEMVRIRHAMASLAIACGEPAILLNRLNTALCRRGGSPARMG